MGQISSGRVVHTFDRGAARDVEAALTFIVPTDTKPAFQSAAYTGSAPRLFFGTESHRVPITDARPQVAGFTLDREGFELHRHVSEVSNFYDDDAIQARYKREIEVLLTRVLGARRVVVFDVTRRRSDGGTHGTRAPADRVHVDYTIVSGPHRMRDVLGNDEAQNLLRARTPVMQVNVWRPIHGPVQRAPLALADASSIRPRDLIATDQIFPDRVGEIYHVAYDPGQRWFYVPRMMNDEALLIKSWDSRADGRARFTPHGAFVLPATSLAAPVRESIEVRTFVVLNDTGTVSRVDVSAS